MGRYKPDYSYGHSQSAQRRNDIKAGLRGETVWICGQEIPLSEVSSSRRLSIALTAEGAHDKKATTYFVIEAGDNEYVKIGSTKQKLPSRVRSGMQTGNRRELQVLASVRGNYEVQLHFFCRLHHERGEWYRRAPEVNAIISHVLQNDILPHPIEWERLFHVSNADDQAEVYLPVDRVA